MKLIELNPKSKKLYEKAWDKFMKAKKVKPSKYYQELIEYERRKQLHYFQCGFIDFVMFPFKHGGIGKKVILANRKTKFKIKIKATPFMKQSYGRTQKRKTKTLTNRSS